MTTAYIPRARCGVRCLDDLMARCRVDEITGCWIWSGAVSRSNTRDVQPTTRVWLPDAEVLGAGKLMTAGRAAWILAGKKAGPRDVIFKHVCHDVLCINPAHACAVTRAEMHRRLAASGLLRGDPVRAVVNRQNMLKMATPPEVVRQAEAMLDEGRMCKEVRARFGLASETVALIRNGRHPNSAGRTVRGASVFNLGAP
jgi:hypothetical protein